MITAKEMRKITDTYHSEVDEKFLKLCEDHIRMSAVQGKGHLDIKYSNVNYSTRQQLLKGLADNGFKLTEDLTNEILTVEW